MRTPHFIQRSLQGIASALLLFALSPALSAQRLVIEYFGEERGHSEVETGIVVVGIVRNVGTASSPAETFRFRCYPLSGLDYTFGETMPTLPAISPGEAVACRWNLSLKSGTSPALIAALLEPLDRKAQNIAQTQIASIPRLRMRRPLLTTAPVAPAVRTASQLPPPHPDRVQIQLLQDEQGSATLLLSAREGETWTPSAILFPLLSVKSANTGQSGWTENFRLSEVKVTRTATATTLLLIGTIGTRWASEIELEIKRDTAAVEGKIRLTPRRSVTLEEVCLPTFLTPLDSGSRTADGVPQKVTLTDATPGTSSLKAEKVGGVLMGIAVSETAPLSGFRAELNRTGFLNPILTTKWISEGNGRLLPAGTKIVVPFRLFSISTAGGVTDARRFSLP